MVLNFKFDVKRNRLQSTDTYISSSEDSLTIKTSQKPPKKLTRDQRPSSAWGALFGAAKRQSTIGRSLTPTLKREERLDSSGRLIDNQGRFIDSKGRRIDVCGRFLNEKDEFVDQMGRRVDCYGRRIDKFENFIDKKGRRINEYGQLIDEKNRLINEKGQLVNKAGLPINENGFLIDDMGNLVNAFGQYISEEGRLIDEQGRFVDSKGDLCYTVERILAYKSPIETTASARHTLKKKTKTANKFDHLRRKVNEKGFLINAQGKRINEKGVMVDAIGRPVNLNGHLIDEDGRTIDKKGRLLHKDGHFIDKAGRPINTGGRMVNLQGRFVNEIGEIVNEKDEIIDIFGRPLIQVEFQEQFINENGEFDSGEDEIYDKLGRRVTEEMTASGISGRRGTFLKVARNIVAKKMVRIMKLSIPTDNENITAMKNDIRNTIKKSDTMSKRVQPKKQQKFRSQPAKKQRSASENSLKRSLDSELEYSLEGGLESQSQIQLSKENREERSGSRHKRSRGAQQFSEHHHTPRRLRRLRQIPKQSNDELVRLLPQCLSDAVTAQPDDIHTYMAGWLRQAGDNWVYREHRAEEISTQLHYNEQMRYVKKIRADRLKNVREKTKEIHKLIADIAEEVLPKPKKDPNIKQLMERFRKRRQEVFGKMAREMVAQGKAKKPEVHIVPNPSRKEDDKKKSENDINNAPLTTVLKQGLIPDGWDFLLDWNEHGEPLKIWFKTDGARMDLKKNKNKAKAPEKRGKIPKSIGKETKQMTMNTSKIAPPKDKPKLRAKGKLPTVNSVKDSKVKPKVQQKTKTTNENVSSPKSVKFNNTLPKVIPLKPQKTKLPMLQQIDKKPNKSRISGQVKRQLVENTLPVNKPSVEQVLMSRKNTVAVSLMRDASVQNEFTFSHGFLDEIRRKTKSGITPDTVVVEKLNGIVEIPTVDEQWNQPIYSSSSDESDENLALPIWKGSSNEPKRLKRISNVERKRLKAKITQGFLLNKKGHLVDKEENLIDKLGRRVNESGHLINVKGEIIDELGRLKNNLGLFIDEKGKQKNEFGRLVDNNEHLVDENGKLIDLCGRKVDDQGRFLDDNGRLVDQFGRRIDTKGRLIDSKGRIINENGHLVDKKGRLVNEQGEWVNVEGKIVNENGQRVNKDGQLINEFGQLIDRKGRLIDAHGDLIDNKGNVIYDTDSKGRLVDKKGRLVDKLGRLIDSRGKLIDFKGRRIDENGRLIDGKGRLIDIKGRWIDEQGRLINEFGKFVDTKGRLIDYQGRLIDEKGRFIDTRNRLIDEQGVLIDEIGRRIDRYNRLIDEEGRFLDDEGNYIDEDGKRVDKSGRFIDQYGRYLDKCGRLVDQYGRLINEKGQLINEIGQCVNLLGFLIDSPKDDIGQVAPHQTLGAGVSSKNLLTITENTPKQISSRELSPNRGPKELDKKGIETRKIVPDSTRHEKVSKMSSHDIASKISVHDILFKLSSQDIISKLSSQEINKKEINTAIEDVLGELNIHFEKDVPISEQYEEIEDVLDGLDITFEETVPISQRFHSYRKKAKPMKKINDISDGKSASEEPSETETHALLLEKVKRVKEIIKAMKNFRRHVSIDVYGTKNLEKIREGLGPVLGEKNRLMFNHPTLGVLGVDTKDENPGDLYEFFCAVAYDPEIYSVCNTDLSLCGQERGQNNDQTPPGLASPRRQITSDVSVPSSTLVESGTTLVSPITDTARFENTMTCLDFEFSKGMQPICFFLEPPTTTPTEKPSPTSSPSYRPIRHYSIAPTAPLPVSISRSGDLYPEIADMSFNAMSTEHKRQQVDEPKDGNRASHYLLSKNCCPRDSSVVRQSETFSLTKTRFCLNNFSEPVCKLRTKSRFSEESSDLTTQNDHGTKRDARDFGHGHFKPLPPICSSVHKDISDGDSDNDGESNAQIISGDKSSVGDGKKVHPIRFNYFELQKDALGKSCLEPLPPIKRTASISLSENTLRNTSSSSTDHKSMVPKTSRLRLGNMW